MGYAEFRAVVSQAAPVVGPSIKVYCHDPSCYGINERLILRFFIRTCRGVLYPSFCLTPRTTINLLHLDTKALTSLSCAQYGHAMSPVLSLRNHMRRHDSIRKTPAEDAGIPQYLVSESIIDVQIDEPAPAPLPKPEPTCQEMRDDYYLYGFAASGGGTANPQRLYRHACIQAPE